MSRWKAAGSVIPPGTERGKVRGSTRSATPWVGIARTPSKLSSGSHPRQKTKRRGPKPGNLIGPDGLLAALKKRLITRSSIPSSSPTSATPSTKARPRAAQKPPPTPVTAVAPRRFAPTTASLPSKCRATATAASAGKGRLQCAFRVRVAWRRSSEFRRF